VFAAIVPASSNTQSHRIAIAGKTGARHELDFGVEWCSLFSIPLTFDLSSDRIR
jgi:hypothetical protein